MKELIFKVVKFLEEPDCVLECPFCFVQFEVSPHTETNLVFCELANQLIAECPNCKTKEIKSEFKLKGNL